MAHKPALVTAALCIAPLCSGQVRDHVTTGGEVVDLDTRATLAGAKVRILREPYPGLPRSVLRYLPPRADSEESVTTNGRGRFSVKIPAGESVAFLATVGERLSLVSRRVHAGEFVRLEVRKTREISGTVHSAGEGKPIQGQRILYFLPADADPQFGLWQETSTDANGRYRATTPLGTWVRVLCLGNGWYERRDVHDVVVQDFRAPDAGRVGVLVGPDGKPLVGIEVLDHDDPLRRATTDRLGAFRLGTTGSRWIHAFTDDNHASQHLFFAGEGVVAKRTMPGRTHRVRFVDATGEPLARTRVVAVALAELENSPVRQHAIPRVHVTDESGSVSIPHRSDCHCMNLFVEVDGRFVWVFRGTANHAGDEIRLTAQPQSRLFGHLIAGNGRPAAGVLVQIVRLPDDGSPLLPPKLHRVLSGLPLSIERTTDSAGRFLFDAIQPGKYLLTAQIPGHVREFRETAIGSGETRCVIRPSLVRLFGRLLDVNNQPVRGGLIAAYPLADTPEQRRAFQTPVRAWANLRFSGTITVATNQTDDAGRFELYSFRDVSRYNLYFHGLPGHLARTQQIAAEQRDKEIVFRVSR